MMTTKEAAEFLGVSHRTLEDWRLRGCGPSFRKMAGSVRYTQLALDDFVAAGARKGAEQTQSQEYKG